MPEGCAGRSTGTVGVTARTSGGIVVKAIQKRMNVDNELELLGQAITFMEAALTRLDGAGARLVAAKLSAALETARHEFDRVKDRTRDE
jgi:hypothetical protein